MELACVTHKKNYSSKEDPITNFMKFLENKIGASTIDSWFKNVKVSCESGVGHLIFTTNFVKDWVINNYSDVITECFKSVYNVSSFKVSVSKEVQTRSSEVSENSLPLDLNMKFETFVVGKCNEMAFQASKRVSEEMGKFNPLFVYGGSGFGKTHLLEAIGWKASSERKKVCYISAEEYMMNFIRAIKNHDTMSFKNCFRGVDLLMIDDFQFMGGKDSTQEEFFYNLTSLVTQNKQLVLSADKAPSELLGVGDRLKSRIGGGLVVNINAAPYDVRVKILQQKALQYGKIISQDIICMIAENVNSNVRELEGALLRICSEIEFCGGDMSIDTARSVLNNIFTKKVVEISTTDIIKSVAHFYDLDCDDLLSSKRIKNIVKARQVAMFLCRDLTKKSLPTIGRLFGKKDHTIALYSIKQVEDKLHSDKSFSNEIDSIRNQIGTYK
jgi:chromosomal replication initiator protein